MSQKVTPLVETAIFAALAMVLSLIPDFAEWFTPSFGAIPLVLFSLRRGTKYGILAGLIWGLLHFPLGKVYYLNLSQVGIEYILAFACMGLAGFMTSPLQKSLKTIKKTATLTFALLGATLATLVRYICHYIAGVIFWGSYAPEGVSAEWYSFTVNGTAGTLTLGVVAIVIIILLKTQPKFFQPNR